MAYIRIPTGIHTVTATVSRKSYIQYQCQRCGQSVLHEFELKQQAAGSYHAFQSAQKKNRVENEAGEKAVQILEQRDAELFTAINLEHNYAALTKKIKCPHCGEVQPWSKIPCVWKKSKAFGLWIFGLIMFSMYTIAIFSFSPPAGVGTGVTAVLLALIPLFRNIRRQRALQKLQSISFIPPVYYNKQNLDELIDQLISPNREMIDSVVDVPAPPLACPQCQTKISEAGRFCSNCGMKLKEE